MLEFLQVDGKAFVLEQIRAITPAKMFLDGDDIEGVNIDLGTEPYFVCVGFDELMRLMRDRFNIQVLEIVSE